MNGDESSKLSSIKYQVYLSEDPTVSQRITSPGTSSLTRRTFIVVLVLRRLATKLSPIRMVSPRSADRPDSGKVCSGRMTGGFPPWGQLLTHGDYCYHSYYST